MRNIWRIFRADWQRISASVVAVVVIMGLCLIPCLYAWFNIFSNWDPYGPDATSNIRVAVTSEDEGYELLGLKLNIGSMVLDGLKSNNQMGWDFVDSREEALEGVRSGKYYAALIVPADFTGDFVSILDTDLRHPQIEYYENEKKNAIAPKITNKAKTAVQDEINATVVETVTNAVTTVSSVCRALGLDADDVSQGVIEKLSSAQDSLRTLEETLTAMQTLAEVEACLRENWHQPPAALPEGMLVLDGEESYLYITSQREDEILTAEYNSKYEDALRTLLRELLMGASAEYAPPEA